MDGHVEGPEASWDGAEAALRARTSQSLPEAALGAAVAVQLDSVSDGATAELPVQEGEEDLVEETLEDLEVAEDAVDALDEVVEGGAAHLLRLPGPEALEGEDVCPEEEEKEEPEPLRRRLPSRRV